MVFTRRQFCEAGASAIAAAMTPVKSLASIGESKAASLSGVPTLDELGTEWLDCSQLAHMPSLHNFHEMAACAPDLVGVNFLPGGQLYKDSGPHWYIYNTLPLCRMTIDATAHDSMTCRWFAYQAVRRAETSDLEIVTTNRLVMEDTTILWRVEFKNTSAMAKTIRVKIDTDGVRSSDAGHVQLVAKSQKFAMSAIYQFVDSPVEENAKGAEVEWELHLPPKQHQEVRFLMKVNDEDAPSSKGVSAAWFEAEWDRAKKIWDERWMSAFTPGNKFFSGNAPTLFTKDAAISEIYYRSVLTLMVLLRTNLWSNRTFITSGERAKGIVFYWDTSLFSTLFAMLEPKQMKEQIKLFLEQDPHENAVIVFKTKRPASPRTIDTPKGWDLRGYAANDLSIFRLTWSYLSVTQDEEFLNEKIADQTVNERLQVLATDWKKLLRHPSDHLADYGEAPNLLECVPTYIHKVPSFNAANVWMMREYADIVELTGNHTEAVELRREATDMVQSVMTLYEPGKGVWSSLHHDGSRVEMRHCYDFATVGRFMAADLPVKVRGEMVDFVQRELLMEKWMRAQSMLDVAAANSDRPDHGPMGAYDAWPAVTVDAMCILGYWKDAISFLRRTRAAIYEGVYAQAHEFYGPRRREYDAPVRIAQRGGCMRECTGGGAFAETIINTLFGYVPKLGKQLTLFESHTPRGITGELRHVRFGQEQFTIRSGNTGLHLRKEAKV
ncbi:hypothetical protein [Edaphobacter dinghuensis]|uniref:Alpha-L-rhamnosidase six-hairpin glycosidase domain-containing protein n=1 Tax=Edaphobacter dinghuensis TaxID=1560005 RepID=A0A917H9I6_9BACT|nr:hypothetical protein [Edaphobacter dinghuensis]GGG71155.1 hypothetical protein GCM10011585_11700 [Edaphobacter dinghuensis]